MGAQISTAIGADADELAALAASTFPLACPPSVDPHDVAAFIEAHLSTKRFVEYLADPRRRVLLVRDEHRIIGYAMLAHPDEASEVELSKFYLLPGQHGTGVASDLMAAALTWATDSGAHRIWLGVNRNNERAQGFYRKNGFAITGTRTFELGGAVEQDFIMSRTLESPRER